MAKFCTKCGKPLEEGSVCSCAEQKVVEKKNDSQMDIKKYINLFIEVIKGMIKEPIDTIKNYSKEENFIFGVLAILLNSILFGILLYCLIVEGFNSVSLLMITSSNISFIKTFLLGILFMMVFLLSLCAMIYGMEKFIFKTNVEFKKVMVMIGICSIATSITTLIAILFTFISMKFVSVILMIGVLFYVVYLCQGTMEISNIRKNMLAYVLVPSISIAFFIVTYILPKILF